METCFDQCAQIAGCPQKCQPPSLYQITYLGIRSEVSTDAKQVENQDSKNVVSTIAIRLVMYIHSHSGCVCSAGLRDTAHTGATRCSEKWLPTAGVHKHSLPPMLIQTCSHPRHPPAMQRLKCRKQLPGLCQVGWYVGLSVLQTVESQKR